jgi:hypothetical protein
MANGCGCSTPETKDRGSFTENFDANLTRRAAGVSPPVLLFFSAVLFCSVLFFVPCQPVQLSENPKNRQADTCRSPERCPILLHQNGSVPR